MDIFKAVLIGRETMVVTFNNELEVAQRVILSWQERALLKSVTVIRDVFGKLS